MKQTALNFAALAALLAALALLTGCVGVNLSAEQVAGAGPVTTMEYTVGDYTAVDISADLEIVYSASASGKAVLELHENLLQYMEVTEKNGLLTVKSKKSFQNSGIAPKLYLYAPTLDQITIRGTGILSGDPLAGDSLALSVTGVCDVDLELQVESLNVDLSGIGTVALSGKAISAKAVISGIGSLDAGDLATKNCAVVLSGMGGATVSCSDQLEVTVSGGGSLDYIGDPQITQNISGLGSVNKIG